MHRPGYTALNIKAFLCSWLVKYVRVLRCELCVFAYVWNVFLVTVRGNKKRRTTFVSVPLRGLHKETDRPGCTLCSEYSHCHNLAERHDERVWRGWRKELNQENKNQTKKTEKTSFEMILPSCLYVYSHMDIRCNTLYFVRGCVCLGSTSIHLPLLSTHRSSARYLATLTQGKFGWLKINLVFAEKDVKLKKEREN